MKSANTPTLVYPLNGPVESLQDSPIYVVRPEITEPLKLPLKLIEQRRFQRMPPGTQLMVPLLDKFFPSHYGRYKSSPKEKERLARQQKILNLLLEIRVDLALLINSNGGDVFDEMVIRELMALVRKSGGRVTSYAFNECQSAAAEIFLDADERYSLKDTRFMIHAASTLADPHDHILQKFFGSLSKIGENAKRSAEEVSDSLVPRAAAERREELFRCIQDASKKDRRAEVNFSGEQLAESGIIRETYSTVFSLAKKFSSKVGVTLEWESQRTEIDYFFIAVLFQQIIKSLTGMTVVVTHDRSKKSLSIRYDDTNPEKAQQAVLVFHQLSDVLKRKLSLEK